MNQLPDAGRSKFSGIRDVSDEVVRAVGESEPADYEDPSTLHVSSGSLASICDAAIEPFAVEFTAMRAVTGPRCPKCGHFLKAEHRRERVRVEEGNAAAMQHAQYLFAHPFADGFKLYLKGDDGADPSRCRITVAELLAEWPAIAKEMGLT